MSASTAWISGVSTRRAGICSASSVFRRCSAPEYDIVLTTSYNAVLPAWLSAGVHRKKVVVGFHEVWGAMWFGLPFFGWIRKIGHNAFEQFLLLLPFDRFVAVSQATKDRLLAHHVSPHRISIIHNGIDYDQFDGYHHTPPGDFTYCYFGRLGISKGLDILLAAVARFMASPPRFPIQNFGQSP